MKVDKQDWYTYILSTFLYTLDAVHGCSVPDSPENGQLVGDPPFTHGSTVVIVCDKDYEIIGHPLITCLDSGNWDPLPECREIERGIWISLLF